MKKYLNLIICILTAGMLFSCSDQEELFEKGNRIPEIKFKNSESTLSDSLKLSMKNSQKLYTTKMSVSDLDRNIKEIRYTLKTGEGKILIDGEEQKGGSIDFTKKEMTQDISISFEPSTVGYYLIEFTAVDLFDKSSTGRLELLGFQNVPPVANITVTPQPVRESRQFIVDASKSFDPDASFGGGIRWYRYRFNQVEKITTESKCNYIFPATQEGETGTWQISVSVQDNDGDWSKEVVDYKSIQ